MFCIKMDQRTRFNKGLLTGVPCIYTYVLCVFQLSPRRKKTQERRIHFFLLWSFGIMNEKKIYPFCEREKNFFISLLLENRREKTFFFAGVLRYFPRKFDPFVACEERVWNVFKGFSVFTFALSPKKKKGQPKNTPNHPEEEHTEIVTLFSSFPLSSFLP